MTKTVNTSERTRKAMWVSNLIPEPVVRITNILTMAGAEMNCARVYRASFPNAHITSVDMNTEVVEEQIARPDLVDIPLNGRLGSKRISQVLPEIGPFNLMDMDFCGGPGKNMPLVVKTLHPCDDLWTIDFNGTYLNIGILISRRGQDEAPDWNYWKDFFNYCGYNYSKAVSCVESYIKRQIPGLKSNIVDYILVKGRTGQTFLNTLFYLEG